MTDTRDKEFIKSQLKDARSRLDVQIAEIENWAAEVEFSKRRTPTTQALRNLRKVVDEAIEAALARDIYVELDHE